VTTPHEQLRRIDALVQVSMRLASTAPSGRVALATLAASIEPEWLPRPWDRTIWPELESAHAAALQPISGRDVERLLAGAWGTRKPTDELDDLDLAPVAVTPTSQVHRGTLDGAPVAVKILRPGLAGQVRQDLTLLETLLAPLGAAFPALDTGALMRELRERVLDDLDLESEATAQRRFHRALRGHPFLAVPAPITRLASDGVLVTEWADGQRLDDDGLDQATRDTAAARLVTFVIGGLRAGLVHADPNPADVLVRPDGALTILDFGATKAVEPARADLALELVEAYTAQDPDATGAALQHLGLLPSTHGATALELATHVLGDLGGPQPTRLDTPALLAARGRLFESPNEAVELILAGALPAQELWPGRGIAALFGTIARVGATAPWRELIISALRHGWKE
jgi:hypothetical protein